MSAPSRNRCASRDRSGFSLIEVLAVVALVGVVFFVALSFYTDLSRASERATEHTHDIRRATAILDRVARDFEGAMLVVKPPEMDPIAHPWLFVGEPIHSETGADHVKFVTRNHDPTRTGNPETDLAVVAYTTEADPDGLIALYRWSSPRLPESLERDYPLADDEGSYLVADELASFGISFVTEDDEITDAWDSTTLERSSTLPVAVEIEVSMAPPPGPGFEDAEPVVYRRRALIPVRPLDFAVLLDPAAQNPGGRRGAEGDDGDDGEGPDADESNRTVADCVNINAADPSSDLVVSMWISMFPSIANGAWDPSMVESMPPAIQKLVYPACRR